MTLEYIFVIVMNAKRPIFVSVSRQILIYCVIFVYPTKYKISRLCNSEYELHTMNMKENSKGYEDKRDLHDKKKKRN